MLPRQTRGLGLQTRQCHQVDSCFSSKMFYCFGRNDVDDIEGCERYIFAFGEDEMLMNSEAGLYFKFDEENGIPKNCPGFEKFTKEDMIKGDCYDGHCADDKVRRAYHMDCPLNDRRLPASDKPVSRIMEDYAEDQELWLGDFIGAFERMTSNGYEDGDLKDAPVSWKPAVNTQCKKVAGGLMKCWKR